MDPIDLASFIIKIILSILNYSGAFVINEVIMKNGFVPGLCFVPLIKLIIIILIAHCLNYYSFIKSLESPQTKA